ncbi:jg16494 [Pararge aegeria aegeria]|uniref:Jg16494 protein n=1 Tax=Pararge aegeria aegeria TaxID=348720 RepID=A0A8S4QWZ5_9NEOP|nr:jg16494 [Pararge aegeria aegeria]
MARHIVPEHYIAERHVLVGRVVTTRPDERNSENYNSQIAPAGKRNRNLELETTAALTCISGSRELDDDDEA